MVDVKINSSSPSLMKSFVLEDTDLVDHLICPFCNQVFSLLRTLRRHLHSHGTQHYTCQTCNLNFQYITDFRKHIIGHSQDKESKRWTCEMCDKRFSSYKSLDKHCIQHYNKQRCYKCIECDFKCECSQELKEHKIIHSLTNMPHTCEVCGRCFREKAVLMKHVLTHTDYRPHKCDVCPASFRGKGDLTAHYRQHTGEQPFECTICNKRFRRKYYLTRHKMLHTGEKPHVCEVCGQAYSRRDRLILHYLVHTSKGKKGSRKCNAENTTSKGDELELINTETIDCVDSMLGNDCSTLVCAQDMHQENNPDKKCIKTYHDFTSSIFPKTDCSNIKLEKDGSFSIYKKASSDKKVFYSSQVKPDKNMFKKSKTILSFENIHPPIENKHTVKEAINISIQNNASFNEENLVEDSILPLDLSKNH